MHIHIGVYESIGKRAKTKEEKKRSGAGRCREVESLHIPALSLSRSNKESRRALALGVKKGVNEHEAGRVENCAENFPRSPAARECTIIKTIREGRARARVRGFFAGLSPPSRSRRLSPFRVYDGSERQKGRK